MNHQINEVLSAKSNGKPGLISVPAMDLLNLRRLPAMLNMAQTAVMLGLSAGFSSESVRPGVMLATREFVSIRVIGVKSRAARVVRSTVKGFRLSSNLLDASAGENCLRSRAGSGS